MSIELMRGRLPPCFGPLSSGCGPIDIIFTRWLPPPIQDKSILLLPSFLSLQYPAPHPTTRYSPSTFPHHLAMFNGTVTVLLLTLTSFVTATISLPHGERPLHRRHGWARRTLEERQAGSHGHEDHASHLASGGFSSQILTQVTSTTTSSQSSSTGSSSSIVAATSSSPNTGESKFTATFPSLFYSLKIPQLPTTAVSHSWSLVWS